VLGRANNIYYNGREKLPPPEYGVHRSHYRIITNIITLRKEWSEKNSLPQYRSAVPRSAGRDRDRGQ